MNSGASCLNSASSMTVPGTAHNIKPAKRPLFADGGLLRASPAYWSSPKRMADFCEQLLENPGNKLRGYLCVVHPAKSLSCFGINEKTAGTASCHRPTTRTNLFDWNGEDDERGRKVWFNCAETAMKSDRHFWATLNYVHHNPVHHGYVQQWQDWPFSSGGRFIQHCGREQAAKLWQEYPIDDYGKDLGSA